MKRINWTLVLIVIFVALFVWGRVAESAELRLGVGAGTFNTADGRSQELMLISDERKWYASVARLGHDTTFGTLTRFAAGYRVNWRTDRTISPYLRLGAAAFDKEPRGLVSDRLTFDMAAGVRLWNVLELEAQHNSTAGRSAQNRGIDGIYLGITAPF